MQGKHAKELKSQKYGVDLARFTHHSQSIIYASTKGDDAIRYLSSHDNTYIRYFRGHTAPVSSIALSPSSDHFLSASLDNTVRLWDLRSANTQGQLNLSGPHLAAYDPTASVMAIAIPLAQSILLYDVRNYDKAPFATFDLRDIEVAYQYPQQTHASNQSVNWTKIEFSNDGKSILLATNDSGHYILDAFEGHLVAYCVRPQGPTNRISPIDLGDLRAKQHAASLSSSRSRSVNGAASDVNGVASRATGQGDACFSPDGRYLIGGSGPGALFVWDLQSGDLTGSSKRVLRPSIDLSSKEAGAASVVAYNPRHNLIMTADRNVVFWLPDED